ncbi:MAG: serine/threonine protein kinase [Pirellulaceae bacterium]|nr:serine/threonine protein kinase [Pirellulaceae bacterium]
MSPPQFEYIGPYQVQRLIGRGGMGAVYHGLHSRSGEQVAIKVIASGIANQPRFRRRFAAEIDALKRLRHPNIVSLIGYGEEQGLLFYVMEFVSGKSLYELMRDRGRLSWQEVLNIGIQTSAALKHAHNLGIIHRDLKPANLMLDSKSQVKLTDFGIAKLFGSTDETAYGTVLGTADYMPPEQAEGKVVTNRSDLYSLGCLLFALLTGKPPFTGKSVPEVLYAVRYSSVPNLAAQAGDAPGELIELIHQLLAKDPQQRPPTALVVGNRLKSIQQAIGGSSVLTAGNPSSLSPAGPPTGTTVVGKQLTSLDMEDHHLEANTQWPDASDSGPSGEHSHFGTHEHRTLAASEVSPNPSVSSDNTGSIERSSPTIAPSANSETSLQLTGVSNLSEAGRRHENHYTPITTEDTARYTTLGGSSGHQPRWDWSHFASLTGIVVTLVASLAFGWWMLQPPSADQLYRKIMQVTQASGEDQSRSAKDWMRQFLQLYPNDERAIEIQALVDESELVRTVRILQRRASRSDAQQRLTHIEQGFLDCIQIRSQDFQLGQEKLAAFVGLFSSEELTPTERRLIELAKHAARAKAPQPADQDLAAQDYLEQLLLNVDQSMSPQQRSNHYRQLLLLYEGKPWAAGQVARIKELLAAESSE